MGNKAVHKRCINCNYSDNSVNYSDWWYCNNPADRRDFTIIRDRVAQPQWCPEEVRRGNGINKDQERQMVRS